ncbi:MAG: ABC transporter ATP-binding protein [Flammeovirgaceae bacterium]
MVKELIIFFSKKISISNWSLYVGLGLLIGIVDGVFLYSLFPFFKYLFLNESININFSFLNFDPVWFKQFVNDNFLFLFISIVFIKGLLHYVEIYTAVLFQQKFEQLNKFELLKIFLTKVPKNFIYLDQGKSNNIFLNQINELKFGFRQFTMALRKLSYLVVYLLIFLFLYKLYGLFIFSLIVIIPLTFKRVFSKTRSISEKKSNDDDQFSGNIFESISFLKYLISTDITEKFLKRLKSKVNDVVRSNIKLGKNDALIRSFREPVFVFIILLIYYLSNFLDFQNDYFVVSSLLAYRITNYSFEFYASFNELLKSHGSLLNQKELDKNFSDRDENELEISDLNEIKFLNVSFKALNDRLNFKINLNLKLNEKMIVVGDSGAGKTTIINTLLKINNKYSGKIEINNIDLKKINSKSIKSKVGFVSQDSVMFNDSLFNNITLWDIRNNDNISRVNNLLSKFNLERFSKDLFEEDINLKEKLSGGEKQRLNLIRELYKKPELLLLDEITSSLDIESKKIILNHIKNLDIKFIFITHDREVLSFFNEKIKVLEIKNLL